MTLLGAHQYHFRYAQKSKGVLFQRTSNGWRTRAIFNCYEAFLRFMNDEKRGWEDLYLWWHATEPTDPTPNVRRDDPTLLQTKSGTLRKSAHWEGPDDLHGIKINRTDATDEHKFQLTEEFYYKVVK